MPVPVIIIAGFLGCGKTSFLRNLIPLCAETGQKPALIVNEVGDVDVDGELLADLHAEQVRLVGGCVCCTLQSQLTGTVYDILEQGKYDLIIIECSGLSNPLDVVTALSAPALLTKVAVSHIVCLVDAARAATVLKNVELAHTQAAGSNILVLNKADTVAPEDRTVAESAAAEASPHAKRFWAAYGDIGREQMLKVLTDPAPSHCGCGCCHGRGHDHEHEHDHSHTLPASFCTVALSLPDPMERHRLEQLIATLPKNVIRAKGFANLQDEGWHMMHKVYDTYDIAPHKGQQPALGAFLVCIGQHLAVEELRELVGELGNG